MKPTLIHPPRHPQTRQQLVAPLRHINVGEEGSFIIHTKCLTGHMDLQLLSVSETVIAWLAAQDIKHPPIFLGRSGNVFSYFPGATMFR